MKKNNSSQMWSWDRSHTHTVKLNKRGAYLNKMTGGATRGGVHRNRKKELSRNFCRKSSNG